MYAPTLHNGLATISDRAITQPDSFYVSSDLATVRLADLSENPALWEGTLRNLSSIVGRLIGERSGSPAQPETAALTRILATHFGQEYREFLNRYGAVTRPRPAMPAGVRYSTPEEQRAWNDMVDRDLAREPRWGDSAQRLFAREVEYFTRVDAESK